MKRVVNCLMVFVLSLLIMSGINVKAQNDFKEENITINFKPTKGVSKKSVGTIDILWNDRYFNKESINYNHNLARTSLALSASAYNANTRDNTQYVNNALIDLGFENNVKNINYEDSNRINKVGYTIAQKNINLDGNNYTIIAVVIRGTNNKEWYGNFNIANIISNDIITGKKIDDSGFHMDFKNAEEDILLELDNYIKGIDGKLKIWIMGHSRGAAVANLLASDLSQEEKYTTKNNIYAYTFATPNVTKNPKEDKNIFNFVNGEDFVTYCPLEQWGYKKNGITFQFQTLIDDLKSNSNLINDLKLDFYKLTEQDYESYPNSIKDTEKFAKDTYSIVKNIEEYYFKEYELKKSNNGYENVKSSLYGYFNKVADLLVGTDSEKKKAIVFMLDTLDTKFAPLTRYLIWYNGSIPVITKQRSTYSHMPETYMSWLNVIDESDVNISFINSKEKTIKIVSTKKEIVIGETLNLKAKTVGIKERIKWSVSDKKLASIDSKTGKLKAKKAGTVTVTAKAGGKSDRCKVKIVEKKKN